jgi:hypothetical protein
MTWFWAAYQMTTDRRGISALLLHDQLGMSYKSAWLMLHKLRRATVAPERTRLRGVIEMDETWVGGWQSGVRGSRQLKGRKAALVIVAVERRGRATGRARMEVIPDFRQKTLNEFALRNIELGSTIYTDKMPGFAGFAKVGLHPPSDRPGQHQARHAAHRAARRSRDGQSQTVAAGHVPRCQPCAAPSLSGRVRVPA